jgi:beta-lactam-binding protein with PASTA domain
VKDIFGFLKSRTFLKHLGIAVLALVLVFWLIFEGLDIYTHHGKTIAVPEFRGLKIKSLDEFIKGKQLKYLVIDSLYDTKKEKGVVIRQEPEPGTRVKQERTVYLYISSVLPPRVSMPLLLDKSLRLAVGTLESYGLKLAKPIKRRPDVCNGCVLEQEYKGKRIAKGAWIERGSEITLTVGEGHGGGEPVGIPNLIGLTRRQAVLLLNESNLSEGTPVFDTKQKEKLDTATAKIYKQVPASGTDRTVSPGSSIDFYLSNDKTRIKSPSDTPQ